MAILLFKLIMTPLFIGGVTLAGRRWGPAVSGMLMGIPLTSGPISVFLALQYGPAFAVRAGAANVAGQGSACVFYLVYGLAARRRPWTVCASVSLLAFCLGTVLLDAFPWSILSASLLLAAMILVVTRTLPRQEVPAAPVAPPRWDLPARMVVATAFVLALTATAQELGPRLSGLIAPFPIYGVVLAAFTHRHQGGRAAAQVVRGNAVGSVAFMTFFVIACWGLANLHLAVAYLLAALGAVAAGSLAILANRRAPMPCGM